MPIVSSPLALKSSAYPNPVVSVPTFCHTRYLARLENAGCARVDAERSLFAWYDTVCREWRGKPIGDREGDFWDKRFEEWQGATPAPPRATGSSMTSVAAQNAQVLARRKGKA